MPVIEYDYDSEWIIAKSRGKSVNSSIQYWIIKNNFESEPTLDMVKSNTVGPLDEELFAKEFTSRKIHLKLRKIE